MIHLSRNLKGARRMAEVVFSIPVSGTILIEGNSIKISVRETTITTRIEGAEALTTRLVLEHGRTLFDLVLEIARGFVQDSRENEFTGAQLYHIAVEKYPNLNLRRNSWGSHMIASSPNHPSYSHYTSRRKYFRYLQNGRYSLDKSLVSVAGDK
jgi:hypothetical protein